MASTRASRAPFALGAAIGFVVGLPAFSAAVYLLSLAGLGDTGRSYADVLRLALIFAGAPIVLTAGGVGRVAARAADRGALAPLRAGASVMAVAGVGLIILVALPVGGLPDSWPPWLWYLPAGGVTGAAVGAAIGAVVGNR